MLDGKDVTFLAGTKKPGGAGLFKKMPNAYSSRKLRR